MRSAAKWSLRTRGLALVCCVVVTPVAVRGADDPALAAAVKSLLTAGWQPSAAGYREAGTQYAAAHKMAPQDLRVSYAMGMVALQNRRYDEARKHLQDSLSPVGGNLQPRLCLIWIDLLTKKHAAVLSGMQELAQALARISAQPDTEPDMEEVAATLGRMLGYMAGPGAAPIADDKLAAVQEEISSRMISGRQKAFLAGKAQVLEEFAALQGGLGAAKAKAKEDAEEQKKKDLVKLDEDKDKAQESKEALEKSAAHAKEVYDAEESQLNKQIAPLARELTDLNRRAATVANYLARVDSDINRLVLAASREPDPVIRRRLQFDADRLQINSRADRDQFAQLDREIARVRGQGQALEAQLRAAANKYQAELSRLNAELARLRRLEKGLVAVENEIEKPATGNTAGTRSTAAKLTALTTYVELPLEAEKERLLKSFGR